MKTGRGKAVAITSGVLSLLVLAAAALAHKDRILAEFYVSKLGEDDWDEDFPDTAVSIVVTYSSSRGDASLGLLLEDPTPSEELYQHDHLNDAIFGRIPWNEALLKLGERAVPALIKGLRSPDPIVQLRATRALGQIGPDAGKAIPVLTELSRGKDSRDAGHSMPATSASGSPAPPPRP